MRGAVPYILHTSPVGGSGGRSAEKDTKKRQETRRVREKKRPPLPITSPPLLPPTPPPTNHQSPKQRQSSSNHQSISTATLPQSVSCEFQSFFASQASHQSYNISFIHSKTSLMKKIRKHISVRRYTYPSQHITCLNSVSRPPVSPSVSRPSVR